MGLSVAKDGFPSHAALRSPVPMAKAQGGLLATGKLVNWVKLLCFSLLNALFLFLAGKRG